MGDNNRKDDIRIYIIFSFFFICSTTGGILLCLYIFLPSSSSSYISQSWFAILGLSLVAIPWIIWLIIYIYQCFKPTTTINTTGAGQFRGRNNHDNNNNNKASCVTPKSATATSSGDVARPSIGSYESTAGGGDGGERHVQFGEVMAVEKGSSSCGSNSSYSQIQQHHKAAAAVVDRREEFSGEFDSERPLNSDTRS